MLVPGCVRDGSLRDACEPGKSISDVGREPKWGEWAPPLVSILGFGRG